MVNHHLYGALLSISLPSLNEHGLSPSPMFFVKLTHVLLIYDSNLEVQQNEKLVILDIALATWRPFFLIDAMGVVYLHY